MVFPSWWNSIGNNGFPYMSCLTLHASMKAGPSRPPANFIRLYGKEALKLFTCTSCTWEHDAVNDFVMFTVYS